MGFFLFFVLSSAALRICLDLFFLVIKFFLFALGSAVSDTHFAGLLNQRPSEIIHPRRGLAM